MYETKVITRKCIKTNVEQTESNGRPYLYLHPIGDLVQGSLLISFHRGFHVCTEQGSFLKRLFKSFLVQKSFHRGFHVCTNQGNFLRNFLIQRGFHKDFGVCTNQGNFLRNFLINCELKNN
jgi:hypothetical protein